MRIEIVAAIKERLANQINEIRNVLRKKIDLETWMDDPLRSGIVRYSTLFAVTSILNAINILIYVYVKDFNPNATIEGLYAQKEIGSIVYFFSHYPQNIFGFVLLWGMMPILLGACWYVSFTILKGKGENPSKPTILLLSLNTLLIPILGIAAQEVFSLLKFPFVAGKIIPLILTFLWAVLTLGTYIGSLLYAIQGFRKQFDQPTGRAAVIALSPAVFALIGYALFY
ncbi:hypothetical protein LEP1GSC050_4353 [Leptospira broomii serovar Hurstbridge str. 5399]|uniref:Yip1 domain protein n=1 Tax=Leptospira broomii serovar Hurstbridge str. 5399 TaxID=1049789 RepID=T0FDK9_9LEPT|nr:hypothetical protein [Leptospira broomii]EQA45956.1 hypothetical protein LEP1GSC050_4353 [Leptospira broomii serovar Hurstbridge str. 5399]